MYSPFWMSLEYKKFCYYWDATSEKFRIGSFWSIDLLIWWKILNWHLKTLKNPRMLKWGTIEAETGNLKTSKKEYYIYKTGQTLFQSRWFIIKKSNRFKDLEKFQDGISHNRLIRKTRDVFLKYHQHSEINISKDKHDSSNAFSESLPEGWKKWIVRSKDETEKFHVLPLNEVLAMH